MDNNRSSVDFTLSWKARSSIQIQILDKCSPREWGVKKWFFFLLSKALNIAPAGAENPADIKLMVRKSLRMGVATWYSQRGFLMENFILSTYFVVKGMIDPGDDSVNFICLREVMVRLVISSHYRYHKLSPLPDVIQEWIVLHTGF